MYKGLGLGMQGLGSSAEGCGIGVRVPDDLCFVHLFILVEERLHLHPHADEAPLLRQLLPLVLEPEG